MTGELFRRRSGISIVHVPYKGGPEADDGAARGQIDSLFAITRPRCRISRAGNCGRSPSQPRAPPALLPQVPTRGRVRAAGFEAVTWFGFTVPPARRARSSDRLNGEIGKVLAMPEVKKNLGVQASTSAAARRCSSALHARRVQWARW